jgi:hypothetical protein
VKRRVTIIILAVLLAGLVLLGLNDTNIAVAGTCVYDIETTIKQPEASNSSAGSTSRITMYTVADD